MSGVYVVAMRQARPLPILSGRRRFDRSLFAPCFTEPYLPDPRLRRALWNALWLGAVLVLLLPAARGHNPWLGWMPLWLLGMPLSALWALHRFRLPRLPPSASAVRGRRRRRGVQARRTSQRSGTRRRARAA